MAEVLAGGVSAGLMQPDSTAGGRAMRDAETTACGARVTAQRVEGGLHRDGARKAFQRDRGVGFVEGLEPGKWADIIATPLDPSQDV